MIGEQLDFFDKVDKPEAFTEEMEKVWRDYINGNLFNVGINQIMLRDLIINNQVVKEYLGIEKADNYISWSKEREQKQMEESRREAGDMYRR